MKIGPLGAFHKVLKIRRVLSIVIGLTFLGMHPALNPLNHSHLIPQHELSSTYAYTKTLGGKALTWSKGASIKYQISQGATPQDIKVVAEVTEKLSQLTGYHFIYSGLSKTTAQTDSPFTWSNGSQNLLISFASPEVSDLLGGMAAGSTVVTPTNLDKAHLDAGAIAFNQNIFNGLTPGLAAGRSQGNLVFHEFGHLIGLDHVTNPSEIMNPTLTSFLPDGPSAGYLAGIAHLYP